MTVHLHASRRANVQIIHYLIILLVVIFSVGFTLLNLEIVTLHYYWGQQAMPLSLLLAMVFGLGCVMGLLIGGYLLIKARILIYQLRRRLVLAEKEIENLRAIPLQDKV